MFDPSRRIFRLRRLSLIFAGALAAIALACGGADPTPTRAPVQSQPTATPVPPTSTPAPTAVPTATSAPVPTAMPAATATPAPVAATVRVESHATFGPILVDGDGRTLYLFTRDAPGVTNCAGGCLNAWPPLFTDGAPNAGEGVIADRLATITTGGKSQVTYNGWPLYYFVQDASAGDAKGQDVNDVWFVVTPDGGPVYTKATINLESDSSIGPILQDASGRTLYLFTRDTAGASNCAGNCARNWPPLLTVDAPSAGEGVAADRLTTIERADGRKQVAYNGWPLYYFAKDGAGDTAGQAVGGVWWAVSSYGGPVHTSAALALTESTDLGKILVDSSGRTLYLFTRDAPGVSNCSGNCALNWPPLLTTGDPTAGEGLTADRIGVLTRADGTRQVTYNGWALYYFARDGKPGDATGQNVGTVWFVLTADGGPLFTKATVNLKTDGPAPILVDASGRTLYLFTRDNVNVTNCSGNCARSWPPVLTVDAPAAGEGVAADRLTTFDRADGRKQVAYNGWPLYYFARDAAGDTAGQAVGGVWWLVSSYGGPIQNAATVSTADVGAHGKVLVDSSGRSLYLFTRDTSGVSSCSGSCALNWQPLLTLDSPAAGEGTQASLLGTASRADGTKQVTYNGLPLYYYAKDLKPGDALGQNVGTVWFLVRSDGTAVQ